MLDDEEPRRYDLRRQLNGLEKCAENCAKVSGQILNEFLVWQTYAIQLRLACTAAEGSTIHFRATIRNHADFRPH